MAAQGGTVDEAMATVRYGIGGDNIAGVKQANHTIIPLSVQYSPEYLDTLDKVKNTPVATADGRSVPLRDVADVSIRKMPEMIRNDNGNLAGDRKSVGVGKEGRCRWSPCRGKKQEERQ